jgi:NAD(P)-dependent dehydrogenase (short-subunit alcohol dehydrogenase family)
VDLQLTEKIVVITGASSGIGRATALTVAAEGGIRMAARLLTRRLGRAEDLANVIAYRVSSLSHEVTAAEWSVDGGIQRRV